MERLHIVLLVLKTCVSAKSFAAHEQAVRGGWSLKDGTSSPQTANKEFFLEQVVNMPDYRAVCKGKQPQRLVTK